MQFLGDVISRSVVRSETQELSTGRKKDWKEEECNLALHQPYRGTVEVHMH